MWPVNGLCLLAQSLATCLLPRCRHEAVNHLDDAEAAYVAVVANEGVPDDTGPIDLHVLTDLQGQKLWSEASPRCRAGLGLHMPGSSDSGLCALPAACMAGGAMHSLSGGHCCKGSGSGAHLGQAIDLHAWADVGVHAHGDGGGDPAAAGVLEEHA